MDMAQAGALIAAYHDLFENVNDIVYTRDLNGFITSINAAGERFFGQARERLVGRTLHDLLHDPEVEASLRATNERLLREGVDRSVVTLRDAHGEERIVESNVSLIRDTAGRPTGARGIMRDVTESKRLEQAVRAKVAELEELNEKLTEMDRIKATFAAMLAHDLKVPLSSIMMVLELFRNPLKPQRRPQLEVCLRSAIQSCQNILNLIGEMLEVFRSESRPVALMRGCHPVTEIVAAPFEEAQILAAHQNITLSQNLAPDLPSLYVDAEKMRRVLINLLNNAVKFTRPGGRVRVEAQTVRGTSVQSGETFVQIIVADNGEGIAPEDLPYIFDPYWQAARRQLGAGLGLAVVKRIVAAHGGNVSVRSKVGVGSEFVIILSANGAGVIS